MLNALLVVTLTLVVAGLVFARPLVTLYAGDYASVPGKLELTIRLTRVMLPFLTTVAVATVAMGMLNSLHHYFVPALSPAMFNVATIVCAVVLVPVMPSLGLPRIMAIAIAVLLGGLGQILVQWPPLAPRRLSVLARASIRATRRCGDVMLLMGPGDARTGGDAGQHLREHAARDQPGNRSGVVADLCVPAHVSADRTVRRVDRHRGAAGRVAARGASTICAGIRTTVSRGLAMMLMLNVPATLGLLVLARPIVELLFEHGRFTAADTEATAAALRLYAVGLVGYSAARIVSPTFYALRQSQIAVAVSVAAIAANVLLSVSLVALMGFRGLALATSIAALGNGGLLVLLLRRRLHGIDGDRLAIVLTKVLVAAAAMGVAAWGIDYVMTGLLPGRQIADSGCSPVGRDRRRPGRAGCRRETVAHRRIRGCSQVGRACISRGIARDDILVQVRMLLKPMTLSGSAVRSRREYSTLQELSPCAEFRLHTRPPSRSVPVRFRPR